MKHRKNRRSNAILYGMLAGIGLVIFYISVISIFQGIAFAFFSLRSLWYFIIPLAGGFGTQVGLFTSIRHSAGVNATVAGTGTLSAGSMVACCSHFLLNVVPIIGLSGLAVFLAQYQSEILIIGILSNVLGIIVMVNHRRKMNNVLKGGKCH